MTRVDMISGKRSSCTATLAVLLTAVLLGLSGAKSRLQQLINATCSADGYPKGSVFSQNLDALFSSLYSAANSTKFHNATAGDAPDRVYGLFACQGDLSPRDCRDCVWMATANISRNCPDRSRRGIIWLEFCLLRFSDGSFFGVVDTGGFSMRNPFASAPDPTAPLAVLEQLARVAPNAVP